MGCVLAVLLAVTFRTHIGKAIDRTGGWLMDHGLRIISVGADLITLASISIGISAVWTQAAARSTL